VEFYQEQKRQFCGIPVKRSLEQGGQWGRFFLTILGIHSECGFKVVKKNRPHWQPIDTNWKKRENL